MDKLTEKRLPIISSEVEAIIGKPAGLAPGETMMVSGLKHQFKTGFLMTILSNIAMMTQGDELIDGERQLLVFISTESEVSDMLGWIYQHIKESETGFSHNPGDESSLDIVDFLKDYFYETPYELKFLSVSSVSPEGYTVSDVLGTLDEISREYNLRGVFFDSPQHLRPETQKPPEEDFKERARQMRNWCQLNKTSLVFTHDLSGEALTVFTAMKNNGASKDFVKEIAKKGYQDRCRHLTQEVDISMLISVDRNKEESTLCMQVEKQKGRSEPNNDGYLEKTFQPVGTIDW